MLDKLHQKIYQLPQILKFFYILCLSFATIDYFADGNRSIWSVFIGVVLTVFNYFIVFKPK